MVQWEFQIMYNIFVYQILSRILLYTYTLTPSTHNNKKISRKYVMVTEKMTMCCCPTQTNFFITKCSWSHWKHQIIQWVSNRSNIMELSPQQVLDVTSRECFLEFERTKDKKSDLFLLHVDVPLIKQFSGFPAPLFLFLFRLRFCPKWQIFWERKNLISSNYSLLNVHFIKQ